MDKVAFRRGFLLGLASYGIGPEEFGRLIMNRYSKTAGITSGLSSGVDLLTAGAIGAPVGIGVLAAIHNARGDARRLYKKTQIKYNPVNDVSNELAQATRRLRLLQARQTPQAESSRDTARSDPFLQPLPAA